VPSTVEQLNPARVKITVEVPFVDLKSNLDKTYRELASQVQIPGFRKGKVPRQILDQRVGRGAILSEALNDAIPDLYNSAVSENDLNPLAQPEVEVTKLEDGDELEFTAEVDVRPEFEVPPFNEIQAQVDAVDISDEAVTQRLDALRSRFASMDEVDRPVESGDHLVIDLVARQNGVQLEDADVSDVPYEVGTGQLVEGMDDAVIGMSAGESKTFTSTLAGGSAQGEEAEVEVSVKKVQEQDLPAADDEFAQLASEFDTIDELREDLRRELAENGRQEQEQAARDAVLESLIASVDVQVPEGVLKTETDARREQVNQQLGQAGLTLERYLADSSDEETSDPETFWANMEKRSGDALKAQMILDKIADDEEVGVEQEELTRFIVARAQQTGSTPDQELQHMLDHDHVSEYMGEIRRSKVLDQMMSQAQITDTNDESVDIAQSQAEGTDTAEPAADEAATADVDSGEVVGVESEAGASQPDTGELRGDTVSGESQPSADPAVGTASVASSRDEMSEES
jgi:trigger factor